MTRERLPTRRDAERFELELAGHTVLVTLSRYPDGRLAEVFVDVGHKEGAPLVDLMVANARVASLSLQHGVAAEVLVRAWHGLTGMDGDVRGHDRITRATSIPDLVARLVGVEVLGWQSGEG